jgi:S-adenosylmethionine:tRNA ribosyltransferase-isomerase
VNDDLANYDYPLEGVSIAQHPAPERAASRLLVLERSTGTRHHRVFGELPKFLHPGDLLVLNETRVFPARLFARRPTGGRVEVLLLEPIPQSAAWRALARPAKSLREGETLLISESDDTRLKPLGREGEQVHVEIINAQGALAPEDVFALCERVGETPLPPYIERASTEPKRREDTVDYQTVYARDVGAVAAPTAGLHFDEDLLAKLAADSIELARITLHVGLGTFQPLSDERFRGDTLHSERLTVSSNAGTAIRSAQSEGRRIVAVGTTSVRTLESIREDDTFPLERRTEIFIKGGHTFRNVDAMITNFHLPRSSPLVLASAFAGRSLLLEAYEEAVRKEYRFFSYGDAMLIV